MRAGHARSLVGFKRELVRIIPRSVVDAKARNRVEEERRRPEKGEEWNQCDEDGAQKSRKCFHPPQFDKE